MLEANAFRAGDEYFSAGDTRIENARSSFSHIHAASLVYERLPSRIYVEIIVYSYLPQKWTLSRCGDPKGN